MLVKLERLYGEKNYGDMLNRFHLIPERRGRTDRFAISISRFSVLTRDKKWCQKYYIFVNIWVLSNSECTKPHCGHSCAPESTGRLRRTRLHWAGERDTPVLFTAPRRLWCQTRMATWERGNNIVLNVSMSPLTAISWWVPISYLNGESRQHLHCVPKKTCDHVFDDKLK